MTVLALVLSACAALRPQPPEIQLSGLQLTDLTLSHVNLLASLRLFNPNSVGLDVEEIDLSLSLDDLRVAGGRTAKSFTLPAEGYGEAALRLSASYLELLRLAERLQGRDEIPFRLVGSIRVGGSGISDLTVPIDRRGVLPWAGTFDRLFPPPALGQ